MSVAHFEVINGNAWYVICHSCNNEILVCKKLNSFWCPNCGKLIQRLKKCFLYEQYKFLDINEYFLSR